MPLFRSVIRFRQSCFYAIPVGLSLAFVACRPAEPQADATEIDSSVHQFGKMREVMREGQTQPRVTLGDVIRTPHAFAVGALEGLGGEVTIIDGGIWLARVVDGDIRVSLPGTAVTEGATFSLSHAADWQEIPIAEPSDGAAIERLISDAATAAGMDASRPLPFRIEGPFRRLDLHVVNGYCPIAAAPDEAEAFAPWRGSIEPSTSAAVVGFFAPDSAGVMTHHGTAIHAHAVSTIAGTEVAGHVEDFETGDGAVLMIPQW